MLLDRGEYPRAKQILMTAYENPGGHDMQPLVRYFIESGREARIAQALGEFGLTPAATAAFYNQLILHYQANGESLKAIVTAGDHPEIIGSTAEVPAALRAAAANAGMYEQVAALFEKILSQSQDDGEGDIAGELANLYRDWPVPEPAQAFDHLKRANELKPGQLDIALALGKAYAARSQPQLAAQVLNHFIDLSQDPSETAQAKAALAHLASE